MTHANLREIIPWHDSRFEICVKYSHLERRGDTDTYESSCCWYGDRTVGARRDGQDVFGLRLFEEEVWTVPVPLYLEKSSDSHRAI
jgi:hypothetical protein